MAEQEKPQLGPNDPPVYRYRVKGSQALLRHDHKDWVEGDIVWVSKSAALANKWILEPVDEDGRLESAVGSVDENAMRLMRGHEKQEILTNHKRQLEEELKKVDERLAHVGKEIESEKQRRRPTPETSKERPAPQGESRAESKG